MRLLATPLSSGRREQYRIAGFLWIERIQDVHLIVWRGEFEQGRAPPPRKQTQCFDNRGGPPPGLAFFPNRGASPPQLEIRFRNRGDPPPRIVFGTGGDAPPQRFVCGTGGTPSSPMTRFWNRRGNTFPERRLRNWGTAFPISI